MPAVFGKKHYLWKGEKGSYYAKHIWISYHYGKAIKCENREKQFLKFPCSNKVNIFEWANKSHKYIRDISDFMQLCKSCHFKYDMTDEWRAKMYKFPKGNKPWNKDKEWLRMQGRNNPMWKENKEEKVCQFKKCGKKFTFRHSPSRNDRGRYCSRSCVAKAVLEKRWSKT